MDQEYLNEVLHDFAGDILAIQDRLYESENHLGEEIEKLRKEIESRLVNLENRIYEQGLRIDAIFDELAKLKEGKI
ncbi:MAG: hypothetical protein QXV17_12540 [Candidatus Micrarchaeaceae archaeon]